MDLANPIKDFLQAVGARQIEIYNEFSLQHELGLYLRNYFLGKLKVQFERNVSYFELPKLEKREIDIAITPTDSKEPLCAIELKYPRNGQVPETMFSFCKDIAFLEQLVSSGFQSAYFLAFAEDPLFYSGKGERIYEFFRSGKPITSKINKPTGPDKDACVTINGSYTAEWNPVYNKVKYCLIQIGS